VSAPRERPVAEESRRAALSRVSPCWTVVCGADAARRTPGRCGHAEAAHQGV